jgi:hypothetical protein
MNEQREPLKTQDILNLVFQWSLNGHPNLAEREMSVISQGSTPRWIVPGDARSALPVLNSWRPYNATSRFRWKSILVACRFNALLRLPGASRIIVHCDWSYWRKWLASFSDSWDVVVHIGNPSHTRKAVAFFVDRVSTIRAVAKLPLTSAAKDAIVHEADILKRLPTEYLLPQILFSDQERGIAAQTWIQGSQVTRKFLNQHLDLLLQLARVDGTVRLCDYRDEIANHASKLDLPLEPSLLQYALFLLENPLELTACIEHRDFAPWNLKWLPNGQLTLIDWEWAVEKGLPWQDVCHFFYIQDYLFRGPGKVWDTLIGNPLLQTYARRFGLSGKTLQGLTMYYLLRSLCQDWVDENNQRVAYAMRQIEAIRDLRT